jgi:hypothetical protein
MAAMASIQVGPGFCTATEKRTKGMHERYVIRVLDTETNRTEFEVPAGERLSPSRRIYQWHADASRRDAGIRVCLIHVKDWPNGGRSARLIFHTDGKGTA